MKETMGQIIKRLRKERELTQEELAERLNVSAQAISKWENETSMPDISQVVPLANLFGVPTDVLFGVHDINQDEDIHKRLSDIYRLTDGCKDGEEGPTALVILDKYREAIRLYPSNTNLLTEAMAFAEMVIQFNRDQLEALIGEAGIKDLTREISHWAELVIKYDNDIDRILSAKRRLIGIHVRQKDGDAALEIASSFPSDVFDIELIRKAEIFSQFGRTEEERNTRCCNVVALTSALGHEVAMLGHLYRNQQAYEKALFCYTFLRDMLDALYGEEVYRPPFIHDQYPLYYFPAYCLIKLGREEEAIDHLEAGVAFMMAQAEHYNSKTEIDNPLLCKVTFSYGFGGNAKFKDLSGKLSRFVMSEDFASLAEHPRYRALVDAVNKVI